MQLDLNDLKPQEATLELSEKPGKKYILRKFSLNAQIWMAERFPEEKIKDIFNNQRIPEISEVAYYLLKDASDFATLEDFREAIVTQQDRVNVVTAMITTVGISQPVLDRLSKEYDAENPKVPSELTGQNTTT